VSGRRRAAALVLAGAALCAAACGEGAYRGTWEVVDYRRPATSVLGELDARSRLGDTLVVGADTAAVAGERCVVADAMRQTLTVRELEMAHEVARGELGVAGETVEVLELRCGEGGLPYGEELIRIGRDSLLLLLEKRR
jgi:hypothetical protein